MGDERVTSETHKLSAAVINNVPIHFPADGPELGSN